MHDDLNPAATIADAKRVVAIVTEAEDAVLLKALQKIQSRIKSPRTCGHPGAKLSKATIKRNEMFQKLADEVEGLMNDPIPF